MPRSIRTSIATVSISGTLVEKLNAIRAAGFDGVEIFENDLLYFDGTPADVRRMAEDLGLQIYLFQPFRDFEGVSAERLARNVERAKRKFDLMHELGTDRMLACSNVSPDTIGDDALITDQLGVLARLAEEAGVIVGYEALAWGRHVNSYKHAWRLVDAVNHPSLGLVLDSFHTLSIGDSVDEIASIPGERIAFVQIADAPVLAMDVLEWSRHYRCFPGQGAFDVATFTARVLEAGYTGPLSLEIFNDGFRAAPTAVTAADGHRSLRFLEEQTRAVMKQTGAGNRVRPARGARAHRLPVSRIRRRRGDARRSGRLARQARIPAGRPASFEGRHAVSARLRLDRAQRRDRFVRERVFPAARAVAVRVGVSRRRCRARVRAGRGLRLHAVFRACRPE